MIHSLAQDLKRLARLKRAEATAAKVADFRKRARRDFEREVIERMDFEDARSQRVPGAGLFVRSATTFAHVKDRSAFERWAHLNDPDLLEETTNLREKELNALVRQRLDDGEPLPPGVGHYDRDRVSVRE